MTRSALILFCLAACGPSAAQLREARESVYQTEYANVWNACTGEMNLKFKDAIKVEQVDQGYIESKWKPIEAQQDSTLGDSNQKNNQTASSVAARDMFRVMVKIGPGGPPWTISVDGEAARFQPGMSVLTPYRHGAIDEPAWVPGRIDAVRLGIHDRLRTFAVKPAAQKTP